MKLRDKELWDLGEFELDDLVNPAGLHWASDLFHDVGVRSKSAQAIESAIVRAGIGGFGDLSRVQHRQPEWHHSMWKFGGDTAWGWHQDRPAIGRGYIGIWTNVFPTKVRRVGTLEELPTEAGHLYLLDNIALEHRGEIPEDKTVERHFLRVMLQATT